MELMMRRMRSFTRSICGHCADGVDFNGENVHILIGIAGKGEEHLEILSKIALVCAEEENIQKLIHADTKEDILAILEGVN